MSDKILARIRDLLALADHPSTPPAEADTAMNMANRLMARNAIDEVMARAATSPEDRTKPSTITIDIGTGKGWEAAPSLRTILHEIARALQCRAVTHGYGATVTVYGYAASLRWVETLYTRAFFELVSKVNPKYDAAKSYDENVYNFRISGMAWPEIDEAIVKAGGPSKETAKSREARRIHESHAQDGVWGQWYGKEPKREVSKSIIAAYRRHAEKVGDETLVTTGQHGKYRRAFMDAFTMRLARRIREAEREAKADAGSGMEVALRDGMEDIMDALFADFPDLSPEARAAREKADRERREREEREREEMLEKMTDRQREDFLEKEHREARRNADRNRKYWDEQEKARSDSAGSRLGASAADRVDLSRSENVDEAGRTRSLNG